MDEMKVGGEVLAFCTTCKTLKDHIIVAMLGEKPAKVECMGCHKQHAFRGAPGAKKAAKPRAAKATPPPPVDDLDAKLAGREGEARAYAPKERFAVDELVRHPSFGVGLVVALPAPQRVEVAFRGGRKLLLHDRDAAVPSTLERPAPRNDDDERRVTDAPPDK
jgi:hypothetical protein